MNKTKLIIDVEGKIIDQLGRVMADEGFNTKAGFVRYILTQYLKDKNEQECKQ